MQIQFMPLLAFCLQKPVSVRCEILTNLNWSERVSGWTRNNSKYDCWQIKTVIENRRSPARRSKCGGNGRKLLTNVMFKK